MTLPEPTVGTSLRRHGAALCVAALAGVLLFWPTLQTLIYDLWMDDDLSHGLLVPFISAWILFSRRKELAGLPARRSLWGLAFLAASLVVFAVGYRTFTNVLQRIGMWGFLVGSVWFLVGSAVLRRQPFPFAFLLFSIPPPFIYLSPFRRFLKGLATHIATDVLYLVGEPATPMGNVLVVDDYHFEVADACSGVRSLMAIVTVAVLFCYLFRTGLFKGALLTLTAVPVTLAVNVLRIVTVALAKVWGGIDLTEGTPHQLVGLAVFAVSLVFLYANWLFLDWFFRFRPATGGHQ